MSKYQFKNIIGNPTTLLLLQRSIANNTFRNFTILEGYSGTGKTTTAITAALALTCENPQNGEPCLHCKSCRAILDSLDKTGSTYNFVKVNMPENTSKVDFSNLMKEIFILQRNDIRIVYVIEEAHALKDEGLQQALLTHFDTMPLNVYVIMTTTEVGKLISPLRQRARIYHYSRLNSSELEVVIKNIFKSKGITSLPNANEIIKLIIKNSNGSPRTAENLVDFIIDNQVSLVELHDYLHEIDNNTLIDLFTTIATDSTGAMLDAINNIIATSDIYTFVKALKSFILDVIYYKEGGIKDNFTTEQRNILDITFKDSSMLNKIASLADNLTYKVNEIDLQFLFLKIRQIMHSEKVTQVITDNTRKAGLQYKEAEVQSKVHETVNNEQLNKVQMLSSESFLQSANMFGGGV